MSKAGGFFCVNASLCIDLLCPAFYNKLVRTGCGGKPDRKMKYGVRIMRNITEQRLAEFREEDYRTTFGITKDLFDRMLAALHETYRQEHKRKPRFTKVTMLDKLIITLLYRYEYRSMDSIAKEYEVSWDTIADNIHWVERSLLNADLLESSVTCVYKTN